jgi:hypothetical protein
MGDSDECLGLRLGEAMSNQDPPNTGAGVALFDAEALARILTRIEAIDAKLERFIAQRPIECSMALEPYTTAEHEVLEMGGIVRLSKTLAAIYPNTEGYDCAGFEWIYVVAKSNKSIVVEVHGQHLSTLGTGCWAAVDRCEGMCAMHASIEMFVPILAWSKLRICVASFGDPVDVNLWLTATRCVSSYAREMGWL